MIVLGALTALGPFTIDLYLPAFPALQRDLGVSPAIIQLTLTATTIGFGVGQLLVGPWSDKVGRRIPLIVASSAWSPFAGIIRRDPLRWPSSPLRLIMKNCRLLCFHGRGDEAGGGGDRLTG